VCRDLHGLEPFGYLGEQEVGRAQAPSCLKRRTSQLEVVRPHNMEEVASLVKEKDFFRHLKEQQYAGATNLDARAQLHEQFSQNRRGFHAWIFDNLLQRAGTRLLELGCGPGYLWRDNLRRVPSDWEVTLTDFSPGMLAEIRGVVANAGAQFELLNCDAQSLPFPSGVFHTVIANHMLYHLRDIGEGIEEISRVLGPQGVVVASTNGADHMLEVRELVHSLSDDIIFGSADIRGSITQFFSRENGAEVLGHRFMRVHWHDFEDALLVTEVDPLIRYILSVPGNVRKVFAVEEMYSKLHRAISDRIERDGAFRITKSAGLFIASMT